MIYVFSKCTRHSLWTVVCAQISRSIRVKTGRWTYLYYYFEYFEKNRSLTPWTTSPAADSHRSRQSDSHMLTALRT